MQAFLLYDLSLSSSISSHHFLYNTLYFTSMVLLIFEEIWHFLPCCFCLVYPLTTHASFTWLSFIQLSRHPQEVFPYSYRFGQMAFFFCSHYTLFIFIILHSTLIFLCIKMVYFLVLRLEIAFYSIIFIFLITMVLSTSSECSTNA